MVLLEAVKLMKSAGKAIDLGCGAGNETAFLLNYGWEVWAVDSDPSALDWISSRNDIESDHSLTIITSKFEDLNWDLLPQCELILAVNSLPFCDPNRFSEVWSQIRKKLSNGGCFAGHFFGVEYSGFSEEERNAMTFLTKGEILELLSDFEIEYFKEIEEDSKSATDNNIHSHIFEVIAKRRS